MQKLNTFIELCKNLCSYIIENQNTNLLLSTKPREKLSELLEQSYLAGNDFLTYLRKTNQFFTADSLLHEIRNNQKETLSLLQKGFNTLILHLKAKNPKLFHKDGNRNISENEIIEAIIILAIYLSSLDLIKWPFNENATAKIIMNIPKYAYLYSYKDSLEKLNSKGINLSHLQPEKIVKNLTKIHPSFIKDNVTFFYFFRQNPTLVEVLANYLKCLYITNNQGKNLERIRNNILPTIEILADYTRQINKHNSDKNQDLISKIAKDIITKKIDILFKEIKSYSDNRNHPLWLSIVNNTIQFLKTTALNIPDDKFTLENLTKTFRTTYKEEKTKLANKLIDLANALTEIPQDKTDTISPQIKNTVNSYTTSLFQINTNLELLSTVRSQYIELLRETNSNIAESLMFFSFPNEYIPTTISSLERHINTDTTTKLIMSYSTIVKNISLEKNKLIKILQKSPFEIKDLIYNTREALKDIYRFPSICKDFASAIKKRTFSKRPKDLIDKILIPAFEAIDKHHNLQEYKYQDKIVFLLYTSTDIFAKKNKEIKDIFKSFVREHFNDTCSTLINLELPQNAKKPREDIIKDLAGLYITLNLAIEIKTCGGNLTFEFVNLNEDSIVLKFFSKYNLFLYGSIILALLNLSENEIAKNYSLKLSQKLIESETIPLHLQTTYDIIEKLKI